MDIDEENDLDQPPKYREYIWKTVKWMIINSFFGLFPLLLMLYINYCSDGKAGGDAVNRLIFDGAVMFVCIAIVGGVLGDYYLSGFRLEGWARFALYAVPAYILFVVSVNYFLIYTRVVPESRFSMGSYTTNLIIFLSSIYTLFAKAHLYQKEDIKEMF